MINEEKLLMASKFKKKQDENHEAL